MHKYAELNAVLRHACGGAVIMQPFFDRYKLHLPCNIRWRKGMFQTYAKHTFIKATFPPNISIEKFCRFAKRTIGVSSAAAVRDMFATTASFKRCTALRDDLLFVLLYMPFKQTARAHKMCNTGTWLLDPGRYAVQTKAYYNDRI